MPGDDKQRKAFEFFLDRLRSQARFTKADVCVATGWPASSLNTYWSKQFKPFLVEDPLGQFRVTEAFRRLIRWRDFRRHVSQVRPVAADYQHLEYGTLVVYEFFMPLANEAPLRTTLDALFYRDTIEAKLRSANLSDVKHRLGLVAASDADSIDAACKWIESNFVGYSIYHVDGRFRGAALKSLSAAAALQSTGERYLVDETTAVTRFIFPCSDSAQAELVRYFFEMLFVQSIIQLVNGEDEIWMVETGSTNRIHIWRVAED